MTDIAIRVNNLSKLYHLGAPSGRHQRPDTTSTARSASLRDALTGLFRRGHQSTSPQSTNPDDLWALKDVSFEVKRGEVAGTPALAPGASVIGRNGAGTLAPERSAGESTLLTKLSHITEPTSGRAETCGGRVGSLLEVCGHLGLKAEVEYNHGARKSTETDLAGPHHHASHGA